MTKKPLSLSSIEFYVGIALAIVTVVFSVTWWLKVIFIIILGGIMLDLIIRSPVTIKWPRVLKAIISSSAILILIVVSWNRVKDQWIKDHTMKQTEQKQLLIQPEVKQPTAKEIPEKPAKKLSTKKMETHPSDTSKVESQEMRELKREFAALGYPPKGGNVKSFLQILTEPLFSTVSIGSA
jgi:hypothetical protein